MRWLTHPNRDLSPGEFSTAADAKYNACQNEKIYITTFGAALKTAGMPNHAIVDTGRNAVTGLREEWGNWWYVDISSKKSISMVGVNLLPRERAVAPKTPHDTNHTANNLHHTATSTARASACGRRPTRARSWRMHLCGSSPAASRTARATRRPCGTTASAASPSRTSRRPRPASGTRRTLRCWLRMRSLLFRGGLRGC